MSRTLRSGAIFLLITMGLYGLAFFALTRIRIGKPLIYRTADYYQWKGGVTHMKFKEWDPAARWDAIVIGSSHAYRGYDPRVFEQHGHRVFNLGSTAQTPLSTYTLLKHYVDSARTPLVIIDLYENAMDQDGLESVSELSQNLPDDAAAAELTARFGDLRSLNMFTLRIMDRNGPVMYTDRNYKGRGFAIKADSIKKAVRYDVGRPLRLNERQQKYFVKCLDLCAARGIQVVLCTHYYPYQSDHARHAAFKTWADEVIAGRGIRWLDFAYTHHLDDEDHFCDHNHLNEAGAALFNAQLVDSLEQLGYLRPKVRR